MSSYYEDVIFDSYSDAIDASLELLDIAKDYGRVTKADLYDLVGLKASYDDTKRYWTADTVRQYVEPIRVRDGWIISLPVPTHEKAVKSAGISSESKCEPKPIHITINRDVHENVDDVLASVFKRIATLPGREVHITIE